MGMEKDISPAKRSFLEEKILGMGKCVLPDIKINYRYIVINAAWHGKNVTINRNKPGKKYLKYIC